MIEFVLQKYEKMAEESRNKLESYRTESLPIREAYYSVLVERCALLGMFVAELKNLLEIARILDGTASPKEGQQ